MASGADDLNVAGRLLLRQRAERHLVGMQGNDTLVGYAGTDSLDGREGDDLLFAIDGAPDIVNGGSGEEVSGDAGQWDSGVDIVSNMEDTNPG